jgi:translation initiation factor IF-1
MPGDTFEVQGEVTRCDRGGFYRVCLDNGHEVMARLSGRMVLNNIRIILGDRVTQGSGVFRFCQFCLDVCG